MLMEQARIQIVEYGKKMSEAGLAKGTAGNISIYDPALKLMAISPSGVGYFETKPEDVVVMELDGKVVESQYKPSSEYNMHAGFYKAKADQGCLAIVHTHSDYATTLSCMDEPIRAVHYAIASAGTYEIPLCGYTTFGTPELAEMAVAACTKGRAVLLSHHGLIAFGVSLAKAFGLASSLENLAKTQWQCMCAGKMNLLTEEQINAVMTRFETYGQVKAPTGSSNSY